MNHEEALIQLFDELGNPTGAKIRRVIDKEHDVFLVVHVLVFDGEKYFLSRIPHNEKLPNLFEGTLGTTVATIVRKDEEVTEAAARVMEKELPGLSGELIEVHSSFKEVAGLRRWFAFFVLRVDADEAASYFATRKDIVAMTDGEVDTEVATGAQGFAPTFLALWPHAKDSKTDAM